jgi:hypothetical protein
MIRRLTDEEIVLLAQQVFLKQAELSHYFYLSEDEIARIKVILERGIKGFARLGTVAGAADYAHPARSKNQTRPYESLSPGELLDLKKKEVERKQTMLYAMMPKFSLRTFPIDRLKLEGHNLGIKWCDMLLAAMGYNEMALFFYPYKAELKPFLDIWMRPVMKGEIDFFWPQITPELVKVHFDFVAAKASLTTALFLKDEEQASPALREYAAEYLAKLKKELLKYCQEFARSISIGERTDQLDLMKWRKVAGITPRKAMASLCFVLDKETYEKLIAVLPARQKEELEHEVETRKRKLEDSLVHHIDLIEDCWRFVYYIDKILKDDGTE